MRNRAKTRTWILAAAVAAATLLVTANAGYAARDRDRDRNPGRDQAQIVYGDHGRSARPIALAARGRGLGREDHRCGQCLRQFRRHGRWGQFGRFARPPIRPGCGHEGSGYRRRPPVVGVRTGARPTLVFRLSLSW